MLFSSMNLTSHVMAAVSHELAKVLDCGLSQGQISTLLQLVRQGEHPEALAALVSKHRDKESRHREHPSWEQ